MKNRLVKIFRAAIMAAVAVAIIVFMIIHLKTNDGGQYANLITAAYVLLLFWAIFRCCTFIKSLRD